MKDSVIVKAKKNGDKIRIDVDSSVDAAETATLLFLGLMNWFDVPEDKVAGIYDNLTKDITKAQGE